MEQKFKEENLHLTVLDENNNELDCEVIMYYDCLKNNTKYVFYTDYSKDEDGYYNIYASRFLEINNGQIEIEDIEDDEEWELLDDALIEAQKALGGEI